MMYVLIAFLIFVLLSVVIGFGASYLFSKAKFKYPEDLGTIKKLPQVDTNRNRLVLLAAGLFLSLSFTVMVIEYFSVEIYELEEALEAAYEEEEILDIPLTEIPPPPPPEKVKAPEIVEVEKAPEEEPPIEFETEEEEPEEEVYIPDDFGPEEEEVEQIYTMAEVAKNPEFPGGISKFYEYIGDNFVIPSRDHAEENKGTVYVKFVVMKDGTVGQMSIMRGVSPGLDKEALRVMKACPKWIPARNHSGAPVSMWYQVPIKIRY